MLLHTENSAKNLVKWIVDNDIAQANIVQIWERKGTWYVFYYSLLA